MDDGTKTGSQNSKAGEKYEQTLIRDRYNEKFSHIVAGNAQQYTDNPRITTGNALTPAGTAGQKFDGTKGAGTNEDGITGIDLTYLYPGNGVNGAKIKYYTNNSLYQGSSPIPVKRDARAGSRTYVDTKYYEEINQSPQQNLQGDFVIPAETKKFNFEGAESRSKKYVKDGIDYYVIEECDLGLLDRNEFDLSLKKDLYEAKVEITNQSGVPWTQIYQYDSRTKSNMEVDISNVGSMEVDPANARGSGSYNLNVRSGDLDFVTDVEVTYKIKLINQTSTANYTASVTNIVDFYHQDLIPQYYKIGSPAATENLLRRENESNPMTLAINTQIPEEGLDVYVTYKITPRVIQDSLRGNIDLNIHNYAEIGGYKTTQGVIDRDSAPGTFTPDRYEDPRKNTNIPTDFLHQAYETASTVALLNMTMPIFEDDADRAPGLIIHRVEWVRHLQGNVWDDEALLRATRERYGDGMINNRPISNVTVQLVWNEGNLIGQVQDQVTTEADGSYSFPHYLAGNYIIRFIYGELGEYELNADRSVRIDAAGNPIINPEIVYNGQDYKSTKYQNEKHQIWTEGNPVYWYDRNTNITAQDAAAGIDQDTRFSDATDQWALYTPTGLEIVTPGTRRYVNDYSRVLTNYKAELLRGRGASFRGREGDESVLDLTIPAHAAIREEFIENTHMRADTNELRLEIEYTNPDIPLTEYGTGRQFNNTNNEEYEERQTYFVQNVDFDLAERPRAGIQVEKQATHVKITLQDNTIHVDTGAETKNVAWIPAVPKNSIQLQNPDIRPVNATSGMIQVTLDENLIAGATIEIEYTITVRNIGEIDYVNRAYYENPIATNRGAEPEATITAIIDYASNTLRFVEEKNNPEWAKIQTNTPIGLMDYITGAVETYQPGNAADPSRSLVGADIDSGTRDTKLVRTGRPLQPDRPDADPDSVVDIYTILLENVMSSDNAGDDLVYGNVVELIVAENRAGRRLYIGNNATETMTPGNLDINDTGLLNPDNMNNLEYDEAVAEDVAVLPPYGADRNYNIYYMVGIAIAAVLITGIILIKKKVL